MATRRETIKNRPRTYRKLDKTPIEIGASKKAIPDTRQMVRNYVAEAILQAGGEINETFEEMIERETDLEPEDPDPPWTSQYEVQEMEEDIEVGAASPEQGPTAEPVQQKTEQTPKEETPSS